MTKNELLERLQDIEWEDFEVKAAKSEVPQSCWESVSAFANSNGGWLILGISERGRQLSISGVGNSEKLEQDFLNVIRGEKFNSPLKVSPYRYEIDGQQVLAFHIAEAEKKPVYFNKLANTFIRSGSADKRASAAEIDAMYRDASFGSKDKQLTDCGLADFDGNSLSVYRDYLKTFNPNHRYNKMSDALMLEKLQALKDGRATLAGLLFFGKRDAIESVLTDFRIDYLEVPGISYSEAPVRYSFRLGEEENLFMYYFAIIERLGKKIDLPFKMMPSGFATDLQPQFEAIREALVNLLMHSDYFSPMKPRIRAFSDRLEFMNPGGLPKDIKDILREDFSQARNPIIARIFRAIKLAENAGSGFSKMFNGWEGFYHSKPETAGEFDYYRITFALGADSSEPPPIVSSTTQESAATTQDTPPIAGSTTQDTPPITGSTTQEKSDHLTERQQEILKLIKENKANSRRMIAQLLHINESTVKEHFDALKNKGVITRIGGTRGHWEVHDPKPLKD